MKVVKKIGYVLVLIGGLNWGLVGFFGFDLVATLLGDMSGLSRAVYALVGLSALVMIFAHKSCCKSGACASCSVQQTPSAE